MLGEFSLGTGVFSRLTVGQSDLEKMKIPKESNRRGKVFALDRQPGVVCQQINRSA
ncbi:hypothetical protein [Rhodoblastus sp.]|uniref:hypothetical protein n=1 Tax=Rhodoblastus sp. TaxID=1962975 RepID=UPI003F9EAF4A